MCSITTSSSVWILEELTYVVQAGIELDINILTSVAFSSPNTGFRFSFLWFYLSQHHVQYVTEQVATGQSETVIFFFTDR